MNLLYGKIIGAIIVVCGIWYNGYSVGYSKLTAYKLEQETETRKKEAEQQAATDEIRKAKDAQIRDINDKLVDAISELRKRSSRAESAANGACGTGATLSSEDAEFLVREASRADEIRIGLDACYKQYDAIR